LRALLDEARRGGGDVVDFDLVVDELELAGIGLGDVEDVVDDLECCALSTSPMYSR
jgi:hypothetical protein